MWARWWIPFTRRDQSIPRPRSCRSGHGFFPRRFSSLAQVGGMDQDDRREPSRLLSIYLSKGTIRFPTSTERLRAMIHSVTASQPDSVRARRPYYGRRTHELGGGSEKLSASCA